MGGRRRLAYWAALAVVVAAVIVLGLWAQGRLGLGQGGGPGSPSTTSATGVDTMGVACTLLEVVDGDTIWVRLADGSEEKVRYIGIDAPELPHEGMSGEYLGPEAKARNAELLQSGPLRLETDAETRDEYGRLLAYVWAGEVFVNERLVREGYAWAHSYPPNLARQEQLWQAHDQARAAHVGVWAEDDE